MSRMGRAGMSLGLACWQNPAYSSSAHSAAVLACRATAFRRKRVLVAELNWAVATMTTDLSWYTNISIGCALAAWLLAQSMKMAGQYRRTHRIDFSVLVSTGGMPSAHSAAVSALATSVGLRAGFSSALFAVTLLFAVIVMFDAQSVRLAAGHQARLLNQIVEELFKEHHLSQQKLAELLGHTRMEVFAGMVTGVATSLVIHLM